VQVTLLAP